MPKTAAPKPMVDVMGVINNYRDSINTEKLATSQAELLVPLNNYKQKLEEIRSIFAQCSVNGISWDKQIDQLLQQPQGQQKYTALQKAIGGLLTPSDNIAQNAITHFTTAMQTIAMATARAQNVRDLTLGDTYLPARNELLTALSQSNRASIDGMTAFLEKGTPHAATQSLKNILKDVFNLGDEQANALLKDMLPAIENAQRSASNELKRKTQENAMPFFQKMTREMVRLSLLAELADIKANQSNKVFQTLPENEQDVAIATQFNSARFKSTKISDMESFKTREPGLFEPLFSFWAAHEIKFDKETGSLSMGIPQSTFLKNPDDRLHDAQTFVKTLFAHAKNPHQNGLSFSINMADLEENQRQQEKPGQKSAENIARVMIKQALELGMPLEKLHFKINGEDLKPQDLRRIAGEDVISKSQESYKTLVSQYKAMTAKHDISNLPQQEGNPNHAPGNAGSAA